MRESEKRLRRYSRYVLLRWVGVLVLIGVVVWLMPAGTRASAKRIVVNFVQHVKLVFEGRRRPFEDFLGYSRMEKALGEYEDLKDSSQQK